MSNTYKPVNYFETDSGIPSNEFDEKSQNERNEAAIASSEESAELAKKWANEVEDTEVETGLFSAFHYATKAAKSANDALGFKDTTENLLTDGKLLTVCNTKEDIASVDTSKHTSVFLNERFSQDIFKFLPGDYTSLVESDPTQGYYIPQADDQTGATGVFARVKSNGGAIPVTDFGVVPNDLSASLVNTNAMQAAFDFIRDRGEGGKVILPAGTIAIENPVSIQSSATIIEGCGQGGSFNNNTSLQPKGSHLLYTGSGGSNMFIMGNGSNLFTGIELRDLTLDANYNANSLLLDHGLIDCLLKSVRTFRSKKGVEILGTGPITSFGNNIIDCSFEHFLEIGLDIYGDGNETWVAGCKFLNTFGNTTATHSLRAGVSETLKGLWITNCSFGSANVKHHIEIIEGSDIAIRDCTVESSGNSTFNADELIVLGDSQNEKYVDDFTLDNIRYLGNNTALAGLRLENVGKGLIIRNSFSGAWVGNNRINNINAGAVTSISNRNITNSGSLYSNINNLAVSLDEFSELPIYTMTNSLARRSANRNTVTTEQLFDIVSTMQADISKRI